LFNREFPLAMAKKPDKKAARPRKRAAPARRKAPVPRTTGHVRLVRVALGVLVLTALLVAGLVVFSPGPEAPVAPLTTKAVPPPPAAQTSPPQPVLAPPVISLPPMPDVTIMPDLPKPAWQQNAVETRVAPGQPMIAIVIDDMGLDRARAQRTVALPGPLTLAYLAYANDLSGQTEDARNAGHELLVHVPMEPGNASTDPGPNAVLTSLAPEELSRRVVWNLSQFSGFVGINNHMGSKATSDRPSMELVMAALKQRGLLFLDSRTSGATVAQDAAGDAGIPALRRDVFLDHDPSAVAVRAALLQVETVAKEQGFAIAIGHPKDATIAALADWLPDARARGFAIVPVSAIAKLREGIM
jgi:polysaccharide deacetylase 2 family uncharacterized protein YibQ